MRRQGPRGVGGARRAHGFADLESIAFMTGQANLDGSGTTAATVTQMQNAFALNIGSHATVARRLNELAALDGLKGVMCIL